MEKTKKIDLPVLNYIVYLVCTTDITKSCKKRHFDTYDFEVEGLHISESNKSWIFYKPKSSAGVISHECLHAIWAMFKWLHAEHNEEIMAYHLTYLTDKALELI